jgi:putative nucleotidyltransferase with HDIG domain
MSRASEAATLDIADLRVGHYIHLDLSWLAHPFPTSQFKIRDAEQLAILRTLGLRRVRWSPMLSDTAALHRGTTEPAALDVETSDRASAAQPGGPPAVDQAVEHKRLQAMRMAQHRMSLKACQQRLGQAARTVRQLSQEVYSRPAETREAACQLIDNLASTILGDTDVAIHLMAEKAGGETLYQHALNVSLLAMLLARELKLPAKAVSAIGLGALMHDNGKIDVPERIWRKPPPLSRAEQALVEQHAQRGLEIGERMKLPPEVLQIIGQHHERVDGSGYPKKLKGTQISLLTRVVSVVNAYDNLCNPADRSAGMTPHEALAYLFLQQRAQFDDLVLSTFIRCMGIYPPGTLVSLSDERMGLVVSVNGSRPLKPTVLIYAPDIPKDAALLLDLSEDGAPTIARTHRAADLPAPALEYLAPSLRVTYFLHRAEQAA